MKEQFHIEHKFCMLGYMSYYFVAVLACVAILLYVPLTMNWKYYKELGVCESYGKSRPWDPAPPKSERSYEHNVTRSQCFKGLRIDPANPNRAVLCGGDRVFHPY
jgi:hypothetical protein